VKRGLPHDVIFSERDAPLKLAFLTLLALVLRYIWHDAQPLWTDEAITWEFAKVDWSGLILRQLYDASPPGSYLLLKAWLHFARSDEEMRLLPALLGVATVPLTYLLGARLHGRATGLLAALLVAVNPLHLYYSNEVRYPALLTLLLTAQALTFVELTRKKTWPWFAAWSLAGALALWVQYFAVFFIAAEMAYAFIAFRRDRKTIARLLIALLATTLLFLPWWTEFTLQMTRGKPSRQFFSFFQELFLAPAFLVLGGSEWSLPTLLGRAPESPAYVPLALLLIAPFLAALVLGWRRDRTRQPPRLCSWLFAAPTAMLLAAAFVVPVFRPKYLLPVLPLAAVLAGAGLVWLEQRRRVLGWALAASVLAVSIYGAVLLQTDPRLRKEPWDEVARTISALARDGDVVAVPNDYYSIALRFALDGRRPIAALVNRGPHEHVATDEELTRAVRRLFARYQRVWYIDHDANLFDPEGYASRIFARVGREVTRGDFLRDSRFSLRLFTRDDETARRSLAGEVSWQTRDFAPQQIVGGALPGPTGFAWMGEEISVLVGRQWREDLAYACFYVYRPFFGEVDPVFTLLVEDTPVSERRMSRSDLICLEGVLPTALAEREALTLRLRTDRAFVPAEVLHDGDRTPKSALVQRLGVSRSSEVWEQP